MPSRTASILALLVNGLTITATDATLSDGAVGIYVSSSRGSDIGEFADNFSATGDAGPLPPNELPFGLTSREPLDGLNFPEDIVQGGTGLSVTRFTAFRFSEPVFLTGSVDGSDRIFVVEKSGRIKVFPRRNPGAAPLTFLDISGHVFANGESGLLGMAFDPTDHKLFYVSYVASGPPDANCQSTLRSIIARFQVSPTNSNMADPNSETEIISVCNMGLGNHRGGMLSFGPDGYLYWSLGDGGAQGDPQGRGQNVRQLLGKLLRIIPSRIDAGYSVPTDNPYYVAGGQQCNSSLIGNEIRVPGFKCPEIFAYGMRNPWRFSFDRMNGHLWLADVGQSSWEEIDLVTKGNNLGWKIFEGSHPFGPGAHDPAGVTMPVFEYDHTVGIAIIGGFAYRGPSAPSLTGKYIYSDSGASLVWALNYNFATHTVDSNETIPTPSGFSSPTSLGEDENGDLYVCTYPGLIYKISDTGTQVIPSPDFPKTLSATGLFSNTANLTPNPGLIEYGLNVPFWSDGAKKRRWIGVPNNSEITFSETGNWTFPSKTVFVKHFELETSPGNVRRLETRVLIQQPTDGWRGYTYIWNSQQADADLADAAVTIGTGTQQNWYIPSRSDCLRCHSQQEGFALGVRTRQLNDAFQYGSVVDNQLRSWNHIQLFSSNLEPPAQYEAYFKPGDGAAPLQTQAKTYLAVNCAICHQPGGTTGIDMDFRYDTPLASMNIVGVPASSPRVKPGYHEQSLIYQLMHGGELGRMPPVGSLIPDPNGLDIISRWIDGM